MLVTVGNIAFSTGKDVCSANADVVMCLKTRTLCCDITSK